MILSQLEPLTIKRGRNILGDLFSNIATGNIKKKELLKEPDYLPHRCNGQKSDYKNQFMSCMRNIMVITLYTIEKKCLFTY